MTITLKQPWVPFPAYLAGGIGGQPRLHRRPVDDRQPERIGATRSAPGRSCSRTGCPTTTSPPSANPHYWRTGLPYLDQITYRPITDAQQRANALLAGNIDIMHTDAARDDPAVQATTPPTGSSTTPQHVVGEPDMNFIMCNLSRPRHGQHPASARPWPWPSTPTQYSQVIDKGVNTPTNQPFIPGTAVLRARHRLPGVQPDQGQRSGEAGRRTRRASPWPSRSSHDQLGRIDPGRSQFLQSQLQAVGHEGHA